MKAKMDSITKAASIIIALGADVSSEIFKYLRDDEIEELSIQISKMDSITPQQSQEIMNEFYEQCVQQKVIAEGGESYAKDVLLKAFGKE
ncbi:MAG: flagellar motor switch protein FliG, partial [Oscillospiraceae bacterium]|nr:flagellar motor switch protein FliG [Oscillospiraceae bacterium]